MTATATRYAGLARPIKPDCDSLINNILLRKATPKRVHFMELYLDWTVERQIQEMFNLKTVVGPEDKNYGVARSIAVHSFLGYDSLGCGVDGIGLRYDWISAEDTVDTAQSYGKRGWMNEQKGPISSWEDFEKYPWPDLRNIRVDSVEWLAKHLPDGMCIAGRGGHWCENLAWLFGYETLCYALYDDRDLVYAVREKIEEIELATAKALVSIPQVRYMWASDDLGFRTGLLISPNDTRELVLTGHKKIAKIWHDAGKPYILHACGKRTDINDDLINDVKLDAIHSFEDTIEMVADAKREYGSRMSILGGIDVDFLCRRNEAEIRQRVRDTLAVCQPGGGYALGTGNTVANYIPTENYLAMMDEGRLWNG